MKASLYPVCFFCHNFGSSLFISYLKTREYHVNVSTEGFRTLNETDCSDGLEKLHRAVMALSGLIAFHLDTAMRGITIMNRLQPLTRKLSCAWLTALVVAPNSGQECGVCWAGGNFLLKCARLRNDLSPLGRQQGVELNLLHWSGGNLIILQRRGKGQKVTGYCGVFLAVSLWHEMAAIKCSSPDKVLTQLAGTEIKHLFLFLKKILHCRVKMLIGKQNVFKYDKKTEWSVQFKPQKLIFMLHVVI